MLLAQITTNGQSIQKFNLKQRILKSNISIILTDIGMSFHNRNLSKSLCHVKSTIDRFPVAHPSLVVCKQHAGCINWTQLDNTPDFYGTTKMNYKEMAWMWRGNGDISTSLALSISVYINFQSNTRTMFMLLPFCPVSSSSGNVPRIWH